MKRNTKKMTFAYFDLKIAQCFQIEKAQTAYMYEI